MEKDIYSLMPIPNKSLPKDFNKAVGMLTRPYKALSEKEYNYLINVTKKANTDFVKDDNGEIYTFGVADDGFALMPIQKVYFRRLKLSE